MTQIGLFYGSTNGNTTRVAQLIKDKLNFTLSHYTKTIDQEGKELVELLDIADYYLEELEEFNYLILGIPTWDIGQLQKDWEQSFPELDEVDLTGKVVAIFGLGDQIAYPETFADAMFFLADKVRSRGAHLVGAWSTDGYDFKSSWAAENGYFLGLVIDEVNQPHLTEMRVTLWVTQLKVEFGLI